MHDEKELKTYANITYLVISAVEYRDVKVA